MKTQNKILVLLLSLSLLSFHLRSQNTNTIYFMEEIAERNNLNPALTPNCKFYFDFIIMPNFYINAGNNDFTIRDIVYNNGGITQSFINSTESKKKFFNSLKPSTKVGIDFGINILSFGFEIKKRHYVTFDMGLQMNANVAIPQDIFKLALYGTPEMDNNSFDLSLLGADAMLYSNISVGYMYKINDRLTVGAKAKFLMGYASIYTDIQKLQLNASQENWTLSSLGRVNASLPINYNVIDGHLDTESIMFQDVNDLISLLYNPAGYGVAFDIGATYKPIKNLTVSAAFTDLGFINWGRNIINGEIKGEHSFEGIDFNVGEDENITDKLGNKFIELGEEILNSVQIQDPTSYNQMLYANFILGAEYGILQNKISFGARFRTRFYNKYISEETTLSANFRPANWFKTTVSYSFIDGRWGTIGLGLNLSLGAFNTYIVMDYIPISWANLTSEENGLSIPLPYDMQRFNLQAGWSWNLGRMSNDNDNDGVHNRKDRCENTDIDYLRKTCNTKKKKKLVDKQGCQYDADQDSVPDCIDICPETPKGVSVDSIGCPLDTDNDGVEDYLDLCPLTNEGIEVDENGCPYDDDKDNVPNFLDKCPNTPNGVIVDSLGCPIDTDKDDVADYLDKCPNTPIGVKVDFNGCPLDSDLDGVADYLDQCPETPRNIEVDINGCPIDSDNDGIPDREDRCPNKPGPASNFGCPELKKEVISVIEKALHGIKFESGRDVIKKSSNLVLNQIVTIMGFNTDYKLTIKGYTDNVGNDKANLTLSKKRAEAVKTYLVKNGIEESRLIAEGYGETLPIANNKTSKGRSLNRRVELVISFSETNYEAIENPEMKED